MDDGLSRVETAIRDLEQSFGDIERRLAVIERAVAATGAGADPDPSAPPADPADADLPASPALRARTSCGASANTRDETARQMTRGKMTLESVASVCRRYFRGSAC